MDNLFTVLNKKQKEAVQTIDGPLLILAGPGSGKTKTLTHRIAYLIEKGIEPHNILAVTFTNKAAEEMKARVRDLLINNVVSSRGGNIMPTMGTFHSVCVRFLRENAPLLGYTSKFEIYDDADQFSLMKKAMKELDLDVKQIPPRKIMSIISKAKDELQPPSIFESEASDYFTRQVAEVYNKYQTKLAENNAFDFDDLIMQTVLLLQRNESVLKKYHNRFKYILVDEYQDTNTAQYSLVNLLAQKSRNLCVVGDDAQAIYSWRNANFQNILDFEQDWPDAKTIKLEQNYRSTKTIVAAASDLIENNSVGYPKELWTHNIEGEPITVQEVSNEYEEAEFILGEIENQVAQNKYKLKDFVVLYRTNAQSRALEEIFIRNSMPYKIVGGVKFYQRAEIKDVIAWIRVLQNPQNTPARDRLEGLKASTLSLKFENHPRTKKATVQMLLEDFQNKMQKDQASLSLTKLLKYVLTKASYEKLLKDGTEKGEDRWQNAQELLSVSEEYADLPLPEAMEKFLEDVTLAQETDNISYQSDLVHLMTLHMAKGLEFPVAFIAGVEEGILPHASSMLSPAQLEEERRLCYVGITRAKNKVYLTFTNQRMVAGSMQSNPPSSFLSEISPHHMEIQGLDNEEEKTVNWF